MSSLEDEVKGLREKNAELVEKVQHWKTTAAQREVEKLKLMKEINHLKLKLGRVCSRSAAQMSALESALHTVTEDALSHLVQASNTITKTLDITHNYISDRQELEMQSPRWSNLSTPVKSEKVSRVQPMIGGLSIHPVVALRPIDMNSSNISLRREPQNRNVTERQALPMYALQDLFIPLRRIDTADLPNNEEDEINDSADTLGPDDSGAGLPSISEEEDPMNVTHSRQVDVLSENEESRPETEELRNVQENPLEGPSWLLDRIHLTMNKEAGQVTHEPDSTTEPDEDPRSPTNIVTVMEPEDVRSEPVHAFTPTVRRRKRTTPPPPPSPSPAAVKRRSTKGRFSARELKVVLPKIRPDEMLQAAGAGPGGGPEGGPAPSPNGATDNAVVVMESRESGSSEESCGQAGELRTRRPRRPVSYKEKPLNRKLRR